MPTIVAQKNGTCMAMGCGGRIHKGEYAVYTRAEGLRHPECAILPAERRNEKPGKCERCGRWLEVGQGLLEHQEKRARGGGYRQRYVLTCLECTAR